TSDFLNTSDIQLKQKSKSRSHHVPPNQDGRKNGRILSVRFLLLPLFHQKESLSNSLFPDQLQEYIFHSCLIPPNIIHFYSLKVLIIYHVKAFLLYIINFQQCL